MVTADTRVIPIKPGNRVKVVTKMSDGGLHVELRSGQTFVVSKDDEMFQAFVVYSILADGF